jgi:hypothetical protein
MPRKLNRHPQNVNFRQLAAVSCEPVDRVASRMIHPSAEGHQSRNTGTVLTKCPFCHRNFTENGYLLHQQKGCRRSGIRALSGPRTNPGRKSKRMVECPKCHKQVPEHKLEVHLTQEHLSAISNSAG